MLAGTRSQLQTCSQGKPWAKTGTSAMCETSFRWNVTKRGGESDFRASQNWIPSDAGSSQGARSTTRPGECDQDEKGEFSYKKVQGWIENHRGPSVLFMRLGTGMDHDIFCRLRGVQTRVEARGISHRDEEWIKVMDEYIASNCASLMEPGRELFFFCSWTTRRRTLAGWLVISTGQCCTAQSSFNHRVPQLSLP